jgi:hypothetical protein
VRESPLCAKQGGCEGARTRAEWSESAGRVKARERAARVALHYARRPSGGLCPRQVVQELLVIVAHVGLCSKGEGAVTRVS